MRADLIYVCVVSVNSFFDHTGEPKADKLIKVGHEEQQICSKAHFFTFLIYFILRGITHTPTVTVGPITVHLLVRFGT